MADLAVKVVQGPIKFLGNQVLKRVAKRLFDGHVVDQGFAKTIQPDAERTKTDLKAITGTNLQASINFYNEGVESIAFDAVDRQPPPIKRRKIALDHSPPAWEGRRYCKFLSSYCKP